MACIYFETKQKLKFSKNLTLPHNFEGKQDENIFVCVCVKKKKVRVCVREREREREKESEREKDTNEKKELNGVPKYQTNQSFKKMCFRSSPTS